MSEEKMLLWLVGCDPPVWKLLPWEKNYWQPNPNVLWCNRATSPTQYSVQIKSSKSPLDKEIFCRYSKKCSSLSDVTAWICGYLATWIYFLAQVRAFLYSLEWSLGYSRIFLIPPPFLWAVSVPIPAFQVLKTLPASMSLSISPCTTWHFFLTSASG